MNLLKPKEAAKLINISYPTIKQWIYQGKIESVKTPGGHHRIPTSEVERLTRARSNGNSGDVATSLHLEDISARNKLLGVITELRYEGLFAQVKIDMGGQELTAIIPRQACQELDLKNGGRVYALIKAIDVMVIKG